MDLIPAGDKDALMAQIAAATRELAQIDRTRDDHVYELGKKLIAIRQLLQAVNGVELRSAKTGADGLRPKGWGEWCRSAGFDRKSIGSAIQRAVNPEKQKEKWARKSREATRRPYAAVRMLQRSWPNWDFVDRGKVIAAVRQLAEETNNGKA